MVMLRSLQTLVSMWSTPADLAEMNFRFGKFLSVSSLTSLSTNTEIMSASSGVAGVLTMGLSMTSILRFGNVVVRRLCSSGVHAPK